jgi:hypothetical protein
VIKVSEHKRCSIRPASPRVGIEESRDNAAVNTAAADGERRELNNVA